MKIQLPLDTKKTLWKSGKSTVLKRKEKQKLKNIFSTSSGGKKKRKEINFGHVISLINYEGINNIN